MWPFTSHKSRQMKTARRARSSFRPRLEVLEDRCVPSAGALDPTFGNGAGYVTTALTSSAADRAYSVLVQPDGKIIATGQATSSNGTTQVVLARYNADGSLDASFGAGGEVLGPAATSVGYETAALYPITGTANDGKIIVGGLAGGFDIARYNANGSLDTSFGANGIASASFPPTSGNGAGAFYEVIQPDGKIVALGESGDGKTSELARFNADGSLDTTFGKGGLVTGQTADPFQLLLQPDGKLVEVGEQGLGRFSGMELVRYNANGTLDASFGNSGLVTNNSLGAATAGALYPVAGTANDGKIVVVGSPNSEQESIVVARFNADGSLDTTFGNGGVFNTQRGGNATSVAIQPDGKIVAEGLQFGSPTDDVMLARFTQAGNLDSTFGTGGVVTSQLGGYNVGGYAMTLQANGDIVVAGQAALGGKFDFLVARYLGDSPSFTVTGFPTSVTAGTAGAFTVTARDANGNVLTGYTGTVHFTSSDSHAVLPADYTFTAADQGVHTFSATLKTAGSQSITATDTATSTTIGSDAGIVVQPAAASQFVLSAPSSVSKGSKFSLTLTVEDVYGNVVTGYVGTVQFTSSDGTATLPANYTFMAADAGVHTFVNKTILRKKGTQTITATDALNGSLTTTDDINVV